MTRTPQEETVTSALNMWTRLSCDKCWWWAGRAGSFNLYRWPVHGKSGIFWWCNLFSSYTAGKTYTKTKIPFMYSFSENCAASVPIYTFLCLLAVIPRIGPHISCSRIGRSIVVIYESLTDTWMWKWTVAAQFLFWDFFSRIFSIGSLQCCIPSPS